MVLDSLQIKLHQCVAGLQDSRWIDLFSMTRKLAIILPGVWVTSSLSFAPNTQNQLAAGTGLHLTP